MEKKMRNDRVNGAKAWLLASRPKTLTGAIAPVLVGGALSAASFSWTLFALCLLFAVVMQIDANFVNDYFDFVHGTDRQDRLGPERACAQGWVTPSAMKLAIVLTTIIACIVGLGIVAITHQWELLAVGVACVVGCFIYTTHLSYMGWGDVLVVVFFGLVPVGFTYYVITGGDFNLPTLLAGLGMGLATDNLLMVNNYRDVEQDGISGKRTLIVRFGPRFGLHAYLWLGIVATILAIATTLSICQTFQQSPHASIIPTLLPLVYFAFHIFTYSTMKRLQGRTLNQVLGRTALCIFLYGVLLALAITLCISVK